MTRFHTERLVNRFMTEEDIPFASSLYLDPKVMRKIAPVFSQSKAVNAMRFAVKANNSLKSSMKVWTMTERSSGLPVGVQLLNWNTHDTDVAEIGIMLTPTANSKGYAYEGMGALVHLGFEHYALNQIYARFKTSNLPVGKFVAKLGFTVGLDNELNKESYSRCFLYRSEWKQLVVPCIQTSCAEQ